jgi:hypothetical protein
MFIKSADALFRLRELSRIQISICSDSATTWLRKTEKVYNAILDSPTASEGEKLQASIALDKLRNQRTHYRNHTKAKALLGIGAKEAKQDARSKIIAELPES